MFQSPDQHFVFRLMLTVVQ